jgi:hypothetical protein
LVVLRGGGLGVRVRVFVGASRAARAAYWSATADDFVLVDPLATTTNAFAVCPHWAACQESGYDVVVRRGLFVEVRATKKWHVAAVLKVNKVDRTALVELVATGQREWVSLYSQTWRRLSRAGDDSNIDAVLRALFPRE